MNLNRIHDRVQGFTFGSEQFPIEINTKHPQVSKLSPFYRIQKPISEQQSRHSRQRSQQLTNNNQENQFMSINQRIQTEANQSIIHKPPVNMFRLPRKLSNHSRPQSKESQNRYKIIAEQMKQMFLQQKHLHEQGQQAQLNQLYLSFEILCKQL